MSFYRSIKKLQRYLKEKKNYKRLYAFPVLFGAILGISSLDYLKPAKKLAKIDVTKTKSPSVNPFIKKPSIISFVSSFIVLGALGSLFFVSAYISPKEKNNSEIIMENSNTPTEEDNSVDESVVTDVKNKVSSSATNSKETDQKNDSENSTTTSKTETTTTTTPPAPTTYTFRGKYISATLPIGWKIVEKTSDSYGSTGFVGLEVIDPNNITHFSLIAAIVDGFGTTICDEDKYYYFSDDEPGLYDSLLQDKKDSCDPNATIEKIALTQTSELELFGNRFRRVGIQYYYDYTYGDSYFTTSDPSFPVSLSTEYIGGNLKWNSTNTRYHFNFYSIDSNNAIKLDSILNSMKPV